MAMTAKFPDQTFFFASWHRPRDIRSLSDLLISESLPVHVIHGSCYPEQFFFPNSDVAKRYPDMPELNVLVVGMPNVGKSTLLNALRNTGIRGRKCF